MSRRVDERLFFDEKGVEPEQWRLSILTVSLFKREGGGVKAKGDQRRLAINLAVTRKNVEKAVKSRQAQRIWL